MVMSVIEELLIKYFIYFSKLLNTDFLFIAF